MDLRSPLRTLIPSLDSAVLEVLASVETPLSASAISRASSRGSRAGQQPVLDRLVQHGLVTTSPAAVGHLYALNRDHLLADAVLTASQARTRLMHRMRERIENLEPAPIDAFVFGSFARGDATPDSDIDLLLVIPNAADPRSPEWSGQMEALSESIELWTGNSAQPLTYTEDALSQLISHDEPIVTHWRRDGIRLIGRDVEELLRQGGER